MNPRARARSSSVARASRSASECVIMMWAMPRARFSRVRESACSTSPGAPRSARHSSSMTARYERAGAAPRSARALAASTQPNP